MHGAPAKRGCRNVGGRVHRLVGASGWRSQSQNFVGLLTLTFCVCGFHAKQCTQGSGLGFLLEAFQRFSSGPQSLVWMFRGLLKSSQTGPAVLPGLLFPWSLHCLCVCLPVPACACLCLGESWGCPSLGGPLKGYLKDSEGVRRVSSALPRWHCPVSSGLGAWTALQRDGVAPKVPTHLHPHLVTVSQGGTSPGLSSQRRKGEGTGW